MSHHIYIYHDATFSGRIYVKIFTHALLRSAEVQLMLHGQLVASKATTQKFVMFKQQDAGLYQARVTLSLDDGNVVEIDSNHLMIETSALPTVASASLRSLIQKNGAQQLEREDGNDGVIILESKSDFHQLLNDSNGDYLRQLLISHIGVDIRANDSNMSGHGPLVLPDASLVAQGRFITSSNNTSGSLSYRVNGNTIQWIPSGVSVHFIARDGRWVNAEINDVDSFIQKNGAQQLEREDGNDGVIILESKSDFHQLLNDSNGDYLRQLLISHIGVDIRANDSNMSGHGPLVLPDASLVAQGRFIALTNGTTTWSILLRVNGSDMYLIMVGGGIQFIARDGLWVAAEINGVGGGYRSR